MPEDDLTPLRDAGAVFETRKNTVFLQPCAALESQCCSIYESRPSRCRAYRCLLLEKVEDDEAEMDAARDVIASVIDLRDRVRTAIEAVVKPQKRMSMRRLYELMHAKLSEDGDETPPAERAALLLDMATLSVLLATRFEPGTSLADQQPDRGVKGKDMLAPRDC